MSGGTNKGDEVRSVGRALDVLDQLARAMPRGVRVTDVAARLGVDPGTASRTLSTLVRHGYAARMPDRRYTLGARSLRLATPWMDGLVQRVLPRLARITEATGDTSYLLQLLGSEAVVVTRHLSGVRPAEDAEVGDSYPLWATAAGHALLSTLTAAQRVRLLPPEPYPALTERTPRRAAQLWRALRKGARAGLFEERGEVRAGMGCYAVPLATSERGATLALAVSFRLERSEADRARLRRVLGRESDELSWEVVA